MQDFLNVKIGDTFILTCRGWGSIIDGMYVVTVTKTNKKYFVVETSKEIEYKFQYNGNIYGRNRVQFDNQNHSLELINPESQHKHNRFWAEKKLKHLIQTVPVRKLSDEDLDKVGLIYNKYQGNNTNENK